MNEKMQQLIDELEKELSAIEKVAIQHMNEVIPPYEKTVEKLQAYLLSKGMPPALHVFRTTDEDKLILCMSERNDCALMKIAISNSRIEYTEITDFVLLKRLFNMTSAEYEQLNRDFITAIRFFAKLDYTAFDTKLRELHFYPYDKPFDRYRYICDLKSTLSSFKDCMNKTEK